MSKRKSKPVSQSRETGRSLTPAVRRSMGLTPYGADAPARRLKCSHCPRTRRFSFVALHAVCPTCKAGRWE